MQTNSLTASPKDEEWWVESESIRQIALKVIGTQTISFFGILFLFGLLYSYTPLFTWLSWLALHMLLSFSRIWLARGYHLYNDRGQESEQASYYLRYNSLIAVVGLIWGATGYLFYGPLPSTISAIYFYSVLAYGFAATINLSAHLKSLKYFLFAYSFGLIGATVSRMVFDPRINVDITHGAIILGIILLAALMLKVGKQLNVTHINSLHHQFRNERLIDSLTQEKQTAIDAVATKNRLIASTAHDMRQPVLALDLYANWLAEDPDLTTELTPKIAVATRAVIALFDSMFDLAQLAEGQVIVNLEEVNLKTLMEDVCTQHQAVAQSKRLEFRTRLLDVSLLTDPLLLKRIVGNLIANGIKYTQTGGILVACRHTRGSLRIEVWDTGSGIAKEEQSLVFDEFYKSPTHAGTNDGFGLGLSIVTQLSDKLGYKLRMTSHPGNGTKVAIELNSKPAALMA